MGMLMNMRSKMVRVRNTADIRFWGGTSGAAALSLIGAMFVAVVLFSGCAFSTQLPKTKPSGLEQMLILHSLEKAAAKLQLDRYIGKRVYVDFYSQSDHNNFVREYFTTLLQKDGANVVDDPNKADLTLKTAAAVVGIDYAITLFGLPAITPPLMGGFTLPEIAIYKSIRDRGYTDLRIYAFDSRSGEFLAEKSPRAIGHAKYNQYTFLLFFSFTLTDVNKPVPGS